MGVPGNSRAFNFSILKPSSKPGTAGQTCDKTPAKSPGSPEAAHNAEQQLGVVLMKLKCERWALIYACKSTGAFAN